MNLADWKLLSVVTEGEALSLEEADVWWHDWQRLDIGTLEVPHPSYPHQRHKLWPFVIEYGGRTILFCAGELSNGVWCFYVPSNEQPDRAFKGMTVNERLNETKLSDKFDLAIGARNEKRAQDILIATGLFPHQATETVQAIFANPGRYGYETRDKG